MILRSNNVLHTDSAPTLGFHIGDHWRGAGEDERSAESHAIDKSSHPG
jgi:hypothetical protein